MEADKERIVIVIVNSKLLGRLHRGNERSRTSQARVVGMNVGVKEGIKERMVKGRNEQINKDGQKKEGFKTHPVSTNCPCNQIPCYIHKLRI